MMLSRTKSVVSRPSNEPKQNRIYRPIFIIHFLIICCISHLFTQANGLNEADVESAGAYTGNRDGQNISYSGGPALVANHSMPSPSGLVIAELRFRGYFGTNDEYVELYNNSDVDITVNAADGSSGWTVVEYGGYPLNYYTSNAVLPNGTTLKARSHFLIANYYQSTRSVVALYDNAINIIYGYFDGHQMGDDDGVAIFASNNPTNFTPAYKIDSVGTSTIPGGTFREGGGLPSIGSAPGEYCFVRRASGFQMQDTDDNSADFQFVSTTGGVWNGVQSILGGPAPEGTNSPRQGDQPGNAEPAASLLDTNVGPNSQPNEVRDYQPVGNGTQGTFEIRRKITNTTGAPITRLRLRVNDITGYPEIPGFADLRVLTSTDASVLLSNGTTVTVKGTTVDQPPTQYLGGGLNSGLSVALPGGSLANGASVNIRIVFGVMQAGNYRFQTDIPLGNTQGTLTSGFSNASIYGKVGNTSNGPTIGFGGVTVSLSGSQSATAITDTNGNYAFNNLTPGGSYSVSPSKIGFSFSPTLQQVASLSGNQELDFTGGYIKPQPGDILISEFRNRGPASNIDEFIELYNNTDTDFTVSTDDESAGWTVVLNGGYNVILIKNGTVLKARQHFAGTEFYNYYGGTPGVVNNYAGPRDTDWGYYDGFQLPDDQGLALFKTNTPINFTNSYRLDAVGFTTMGNSLFKEGTGLTPIDAAQPEYSFVRRMTGFTSQDTDNNAADFVLVTTDGGIYGGVQSVLGGPGPETRSSPIRANLPGVCGLTKSLLDSGVAAGSGENLVSTGSTISVRRKITNASGTTMSRIRFRIVDISTLGNHSASEADLRVISSSDTTATLSNGTTLTVKGTTLDQPPNQPNGGGLNSSLSVTLPPGGLTPGASINVQFLLNVVQPGTPRFEIDVPETPCDTTGPSTTAVLTPSANAAGWNNTNVVVALNASDNINGSGIKEINYIASGALSIPFTTVNSSSINFPLTGEGPTVITYFARDNASNSESPQTIIVKVDKTLPAMTPSASAGGNPYTAGSWTDQNVTVTFGCTDSGSGVGSVTAPVNINSEGANQSANGVCTDLAGNPANAAFAPVNVDKSSPTISVTSPTSGIYYLNQVVTVDYTCSDSLSGVASCVGTTANGGQLDTGSIGNKVFSISATDAAGNVATPTLVNYTVVAPTPPVVLPTVTGTTGAAGWYTSNVDISWAVTDPESPITNSNGCDATQVTSDASGATFTCSATSAGGTTTVSVTVKRDATAPDIVCPPADGSWHSGDISLGCSASDLVSGLAFPGDASFILSTSVTSGTETANASTDGRSVCDTAGNCSVNPGVGGHKVDKKAPEITITSPVAGAYTYGQIVPVTFGCTDGGSGVASCTGTSPNGGMLDTSTVGPHLFSVSSSDNTGNSAAPSTVSYTVTDPSPPVISSTVNGPLGSNGWYVGNVDISWSVTDPQSSVSGSTGCSSVSLTTDTAGVTYTCSATSGGGTSTESVTLKRDATTPAAVCASPDGTWHSADVSLACAASDGTSGLLNAADASFSLMTNVIPGIETASAVSDSRQVCDNAGNCSTTGPIGSNQIDKKAPIITITTPVAGGVYIYNQSIFVNYACVDLGSLVSSCAGTAPNGGLLDTGSIGAKTFTVNAIDNVGNSSSKVANYTVSFRVPTNIDECKNDGWLTLQRANGTLFNNQGDCVSYVNTGR